MAINTTLESASTTAASNGPSGSDQRTLADDGLRQYLAFIKSLKTLATLASGTTVTPPSTANAFSVTGVTAITTIASTNSWDGRDIIFVFAGILTLTHGSNLILPGSANITTAVGDAALMIQLASGQWRCVAYSRADGSLVVQNQTLTGNMTAAAFIPSGAAVPTNGLYLKAANNPAISSNTTLRWDVASAGNHSFAAPSSGATVAVSALNQGVAQTFTDGTTSGAVRFDATTFAVGSTSNHATSIWANSVSRMTVSGAGNVTINAPSSGSGLTVNAAAASNSQSIVMAGSTTGANYIRNSNTSGDYITGIDSSAGGGLFANTPAYAGGIGTISATSFCIGTNNTSRLEITSDGRLFGRALHNNAGAVTGTTNQYVASGTYQPSPTATTNVSAVSATTATCGKWIRVGNTVHVVCSLNVDPTAGGTCDLHFSLPIASTLGAATNLSGVGVGDTTTTNTCGIVTGDTGNNHARLTFIAGADLASRVWTITFSYEVL